MRRFEASSLIVGTIAISCGLLSSGPAFAQNGGTTPPAPTTPRRVPHSAAAAEKVISDYIDDLDWNVQTHGALLIVSPEETLPYHAPDMVRLDGRVLEPSEPTVPLTKGANGQYRTEDAATFFDRKIVRLNSMAVLAPRTMTVLMYDHFPRPDPYAGMNSDAKLRLLESTFTDAQWQTASGNEGIGLSDLDRKQQDLYLSLLPDPFRAGHVKMVTIPGHTEPFRSRETPITLTPEQRESVRIQFAKKLDWSILTVKDSAISVGTGDETADSSYDYILATINDFQMPRLNSKVYGVDLNPQVPNRLKPSQLPEDWPALNVSTDLHTAKTVGELVGQIAKQTGAELYCDPRYADRTIRMLGDTARAADLLHALAWSLTATWRRVDSAFVLTDDLVGLGARHVKIDDWVQENALLAQQRNSRVSQILAEKQYRSMGWSPTDPVRPDDALIGKIDAYTTNPPPSLDNSRPQPLLIPVAELPAEGQAVFHREIERMQKQAAEFAENPRTANSVFTQPLKPDVVQMGVRVQVSYIVPGLGKMSQSTVSGNTTNPDILYKPVSPAVPTFPATGPLALGQAPAARALLVQAKAPADLDTIAREAQQRGFNQLWIAVSPGDTHLLEAAVRAGKAKGLAVHAVIHLMRSTAKEAQSALDQNILGETVTQYIHRRHAMMQALLTDGNNASQTMPSYDRIPLAEWTASELGASFPEWGDFRQSSEAEQRAAVDAAVKIASVPGLVGVVLEDTAAPGFADSVLTRQNGIYYFNNAAEPQLQMGYTPEIRLACLRQNGFDPIDLSPLQNGDRLFSTFQDNMFGGNRSVALPFFRDYGTSAGYTTYGVGRGNTLGAKDAWLRWCKFRSERHYALMKAVTSALTVHASNLPILIRQNDNPLSRYRNSYQIFGAPVEVPAAPVNPTTPVNAQAAQKQAAEAQQKISYLSVESMAWSPSGTLTPEMRRQGLALGLKEAADWRGLVLDLGDLAPADALTELRLFAPPTNAPVAAVAAPATANLTGH